MGNAKFRVGDVIWFKAPSDNETHKGIVVSIDELSNQVPKYTVCTTTSDHKTYELLEPWLMRRVVTYKEVKQDGVVLVDEAWATLKAGKGYRHNIKIIRYDGRIYYLKLVNNNVEHFKELV